MRERRQRQLRQPRRRTGHRRAGARAAGPGARPATAGPPAWWRAACVPPAHQAGSAQRAVQTVEMLDIGLAAGRLPQVHCGRRRAISTHSARLERPRSVSARPSRASSSSQSSTSSAGHSGRRAFEQVVGERLEQSPPRRVAPAGPAVDALGLDGDQARGMLAAGVRLGEHGAHDLGRRPRVTGTRALARASSVAASRRARLRHAHHVYATGARPRPAARARSRRSRRRTARRRRPRRPPTVAAARVSRASGTGLAYPTGAPRCSRASPSARATGEVLLHTGQVLARQRVMEELLEVVARDGEHRAVVVGSEPSERPAQIERDLAVEPGLVAVELGLRHRERHLRRISPALARDDAEAAVAANSFRGEPGAARRRKAPTRSRRARAGGRRTAPTRKLLAKPRARNREMKALLLIPKRPR